MRRAAADTVIVGSGIAGAMVAAELAEAGRTCTIVERGAMVPWEDQARRLAWEDDTPTAEHNHEIDPRGIDWPWTYVYGVGGTTNRWAGTSPRFLPEDFEMRSRYGIMRDWPITYGELLPHYRRAEELMAVAGPSTELMPGGPFAQPPHPLSPQDRAVAPHLAPFIALPQSRPSRPSGGVPACCGSARCQLCPVNARMSVLNRLGATLDRPEVELMTNTIAARLVGDRSGRRIDAVECVTADEERLRLEGRRVVVAANGIESAVLLLRSGLEHGDTGRYLFDHRNAKLVLRTRRPVGPARGASLVTGASYAYYAGAPRERRAAALLLPFNPGPSTGNLFEALVSGVLEGRDGASMRRELADEWERTLTLDVYLDDLPDRRSGIRLAARRDPFGLPLNLIRYERETAYQRRAVAHLIEDVPRRLRALGADSGRFQYVPLGAHSLGTLRMGTDPDAVVDPDQRHHRRENLFVSGGAVFPTFSPTHPTLTIAALGVRLGRLLARG
jgi:choline dehydrogenase-like flavoprotein